MPDVVQEKPIVLVFPKLHAWTEITVKATLSEQIQWRDFSVNFGLSLDSVIPEGLPCILVVWRGL